tara:strand:- start:301 stop:495 length:195 start_codon:yes stop_codon:yes gene_type:complete
MNPTTLERIDINKRMIGKTVNVISPSGQSWTGEVTAVINEDTFEVTTASGESQCVNIYDIRSAN